MLNGALIDVSRQIIPQPVGFDLTTAEGLQAAMPHMGPEHYLFPFLAHALGTLLSAVLITRFLKSQQFVFSMMAGILFLIAGTFIFSMMAGIVIIITGISMDELFPFLASAMGTLIIVISISRFFKSQQLIFSIIAGILFLLGGVSMVVILPETPIWFILVDLIGAYIPMAYLGNKIARRF